MYGWVTLPDGLDPDRFVRERGVAAYAAAVRGARRHSEYLLDRARQLYPAGTAQGKIDALNYLLPHIRRMPHAIGREEFANEAAHRLGIDSVLVRDELKQAAAARRVSLEQAGPKLSAAEKELLRALAGETGSPAYRAVAAALDEKPEHFAALAAERALQLLRERPEGSDALEALPDGAEKTLVAQVLCGEGQHAVALADAEAALRSIACSALEREQRAVRVALEEAQQRRDEAQMLVLIRRKQQLERELRAL